MRFLVKTGNVSGAGTNGDLLLQIHGESGQSPSGFDKWWVLDNDGDDLERGDLDDYFIRGDVGAVKRITLWFKHKGDGPDWYFERATLYTSQGKYVFEHNNWLRKSKLWNLFPDSSPVDDIEVQAATFEVPPELSGYQNETGDSTTNETA